MPSDKEYKLLPQLSSDEDTEREARTVDVAGSTKMKKLAHLRWIILGQTIIIVALFVALLRRQPSPPLCGQLLYCASRF